MFVLLVFNSNIGSYLIIRYRKWSSYHHQNYITDGNGTTTREHTVIVFIFHLSEIECVFLWICDDLVNLILYPLRSFLMEFLIKWISAFYMFRLFFWPIHAYCNKSESFEKKVLQWSEVWIHLDKFYEIIHA